MAVIIQIHYIDIDRKSKIFTKRGFPLKGRKPEAVAYEFWRWIKREISVEIKLEKVIVEGEDITELVKKLDEAPLED